MSKKPKFAWGISGILDQGRAFLGAEIAVPLAGAAIKGVAGLASGQSSSTQVSGIELPQEFELDMIDQADQNLTAVRQDLETNQAALDLFNERMDILQKSADQLVPDDQTIARLRDNAIRLQEKVGLETEKLVEGGFLTQSEAQDLAQARQLSFGEGELTGAAKEAFENQKAQTIQNMKRSGASPAVIDQALRQLETTFKQGTAQSLLGLTQQRSMLRQQNLQGAQIGMNAIRGNLEAIGSGLQMQAGLASQQAQGQSLFSQLQQRLRQEGMDVFKQVGSYDLSSKTLGQIRSGDIGPLGGGQNLASVRQGTTNNGNLLQTAQDYFRDKKGAMIGGNQLEFAQYMNRNDLIQEALGGGPNEQGRLRDLAEQNKQEYQNFLRNRR